ncbi:trimethylamine--corrinoid methyltransferase [Desulfosporosinus sp. BICA1-9]|uniref:trimethylamine--corrinoid methyltransferase n=1 Tax=Desulfosporosinus sp. BICA1-9 TaxID=1531958 RepID=UPI00054BC35F|nr:trimethylamine--corrinoid methyltransferase [Desulfosporosinus sp. BICA1-9]KJS80972.1 MAG: trimethylamine:corrinoid methyltransferase [Desulfosporosinus sp. BICA1-9]HBW37760.1 trimethylamine--corrinoid methyltransferase [Desulfosporosinus sp.]
MKFDLFSDDQLQQVHEASMDILKSIGIHTKSKRLKDLLLEHGCQEKDGRIVFSQDILDKALKTAPSEFKLYGRNNDHVVEMGAKKAYSQTCVGTPSVIDIDTGKKRDVKLVDLEDFVRLTDALEYINIISPIFPRDVPQEIIVSVETATMLRNTTKPVRITAESSHEMKYILELLRVVAGGEEMLRKRPLAYIEVSPISPLEYGFDPAEAMLDIVEAGLPLGVIPCPMMGSTGPMTLVGTVAQHNAEILAGVVASQLLKPGSPVIMSPRVTFMDMRSGVGLWAMPEMGLAAAASVQLARFYGIPSTATGYSCASKIADAQSGYEHLYNALMPALIGTDIIAAAGSLENALTSCFAMLVIDNELSSVIQRTVRGIEVSEDKLAVNVIAEVIQSKSNFLEQKHTRKHLRAGELWKPNLSDRQTYEKWSINKDKVEESARLRAKELLATHRVEPLSVEVNAEIDKILKRAQDDYLQRTSNMK